MSGDLGPNPEIELVIGVGDALTVASCHFDQGGHVWVETTAIGDVDRSWACRCGAVGREKRGAPSLGFDEDHSMGSRRRGREGRSISHSHGAEGRNWID
jgi:hypothetical protein